MYEEGEESNREHVCVLDRVSDAVTEHSLTDDRTRSSRICDDAANKYIGEEQLERDGAETDMKVR